MAAEPPQASLPPGVAEQVFLYESEAKIQPRNARGRYARLRVLAMLGLLGVYYGVPWLNWHGRPLVLFDLEQRRFHIFTLTLVPQDLPLLAFMLLVAALTLFFVTSLAGRLWCGYACPQTVWTEAFLWMERFAEGERHARIRLDRSGWTREKILRRGGKHVLWLVFSLLTGATFVAYFMPARELFPALANLELGGWPLFWVLFYSFATWGNAGFMREQVCKYMCPYARFQSAMFDRDTLIISYDEKRGEPRKSLTRKLAKERTPTSAAVLSGELAGDQLFAPLPKLGDCTDCTLCVQVCPTGIDIRKGLQYECIACAACVDACNGVMDAVGSPRGLIRYTSSNHEAGEGFRMLRPRTIGYGIVWLAACAGFVALLALHSTMRFDVLRDRHALYRELPDGAIENVYTLKVTNDSEAVHRYRVSAHFADGRPLTVEPSELERAPGETAGTTVTLRTGAHRDDDEEDDDKDSDKHKTRHATAESVVIEIEDVVGGERRSHAARFLTGGS